MRYLVRLNEAAVGPCTAAEISIMHQKGRINSRTPCKEEAEWAEWTSVGALFPKIKAHDQHTPPAAPTDGILPETDRRIVPALILWLFLGWLGLHRFYAGRNGEGIVFVALSLATVTSGVRHNELFPFLLIVLYVVLMVDLVTITVGKFTDETGQRITKWV